MYHVFLKIRVQVETVICQINFYSSLRYHVFLAALHVTTGLMRLFVTEVNPPSPLPCLTPENVFQRSIPLPPISSPSVTMILEGKNTITLGSRETRTLISNV